MGKTHEKVAKKGKNGKGKQPASKKKKTMTGVDASDPNNYCCVCHGYFGQSTTPWIQCVQCQMWLHEECSALNGLECGLCDD